MKNSIKFLIILLVMMLHLSNESHAQWMQVAKPNNIPIQALASFKTNIFAGLNGYSTAYGGIYRSTDNGNTWSKSVNGLIKPGTQDTVNILRLALLNNIIIAGTDSEGIYVSKKHRQ